MQLKMKFIGRIASYDDTVSVITDISGSPEKQKKSKKQIKTRSLDEDTSVTKKPLIRSKTCDPTDDKNEAEPNLERRKSVQTPSPKHLTAFQTSFPEAAEEGPLLESTPCALQKEVPFHGRLFISESHICFYSPGIRKEIKVTIAIPSVMVLKKANTALLVPNAITVKTSAGEKYLFVSLRSREQTFKVLKAVCSHIQDGSAGSSPTVGIPPDRSSDGLKEAVDISHREVDSHSSQEETALMMNPAVKKIDNQGDEVDGLPANKITPNDAGSWIREVTVRIRSCCVFPERNTVNLLIFVYLCLVLMLLLSSGYIGLRIVALEQQLTSMGAWPDVDTDSSIYAET
ncbi:GRAM domain-containing protein 2B-like [Protopterus annectens]|uniref:GRAM domain-containing protein 2B-like n=1 Tax=Protopterus annectens TaxID=7888 RepID=UPI001CF9EAC9|nr:GRAM domain-containing protein 2B-like [Protopterus annectens]